MLVKASPAASAFPPSVTALIDKSVDPGEDFYEYAWGTRMQTTDIPDNKSVINYTFKMIQDRNDRIVQEILSEGCPLLGELYDSCMDVETLNKLGNDPLRSALTKIQGDTSTEELLFVAGELFPTGPGLVTDVDVGPDMKNASIHRLYIGVASLTMPDASNYLGNDTFSGLESAFRDYISTTMDVAGYWERPDAASVQDAVINIELRLAQMTQEAGDDIDSDKPDATTSPVKLGDALDAYPSSIDQYFGGMNLLNASTVTEDTLVVFRMPGYFDIVEEWLETADLDDLKTYLAFRVANFYAAFLSEDAYRAHFGFHTTALTGQEKMASRKSICARHATNLLTDLVNKYFVIKALDAASKEDMALIVDLVEYAMADRLQEVDWFDDATYEEAMAKLGKVANFIGYESQNASYPFVLASDAFFDNHEKIAANTFAEMVGRIDKPVLREQVGVDVTEANAHYYPGKNVMMFPAGIIQPPMYDRNRHPAQNFGGIGMVVGHELTHEFDNKRRHFDGDGNKRSWWTNATANEFKDRAACLSREYSDFVQFGEDGAALGFVDGEATLGENIADHGGLGLAFDAYHTYMEDVATVGGSAAATDLSDEEADKLFFVSFAQSFCKVMHDAKTLQMLSNEHSPSRWRINGVVMNSDDFSSAFQCPAGAKMNPRDKCVIW